MTPVGKICACGEIVMPQEIHECAARSAIAAADSRRRQIKTRTHRRTTARWRRLRELAFERDGYECQLQVDAGCTGEATTVHLANDGLGGDHDLATLDDVVSACAHCHGVVDARRGAAARGHGGVGRIASSCGRPAPSPPRVLASATVAKRGNSARMVALPPSEMVGGPA